MKKFMIGFFKKYKCFLKNVVNCVSVSVRHGYEECE